MNIKFKNYILYVLITIFVSFNISASEDYNDKEDNKAISSVQIRFDYYREQLNNLEKEKTDLKNKLIQSNDLLKNLEKEKIGLETNLINADNLLGYILTESTPTLLNYLSALYNPDQSNDKENLKKLRNEASKEKRFENLIVGLSGRQIRKSTPDSIVGLLKMIRIHEEIQDPSPATIDYADASVSGTPLKKIEEIEESVKDSIGRRKSSAGKPNKFASDVIPFNQEELNQEHGTSNKIKQEIDQNNS